MQILYSHSAHFVAFVFILVSMLPARGQTVRIETSPDGRRQVIDGFGAHQGNSDTNQDWWKRLYFEDIEASIYRVDLTPTFRSPYADLSYYSPWFMGSGVQSPFNIEDPAHPNGPENNRVRTYTGPEDYSRTFGGQNAPIAVMGPDIDANLQLFQFNPDGAVLAVRSADLDTSEFKLVGSLWSPAPWVKVSSGNTYDQDWWPGPVADTPWPFIWGGNFAGGRLDVSNEPLEVFNDGTGPTSALTQFARGIAAYLRGYQQTFGVPFYAISIQNELNFEQFYNSATYPLSSQYVTALKAVRAELDRYEDLRGIRIMGPEDLMGGDIWGMWQYGGGDDVTHKNLQYLQHIMADPEAAAAIDFFCIHGYDSNGVSSSGADPRLWDWWANGWTTSPEGGIPANVNGFTDYGKKSWMTETSGEKDAWLAPEGSYPNNGGWSIAQKIHQALTTGQESAWIYWTFSENDNGNVTDFALTNVTKQANAPKYVGAKHFFKFIRPGAYRYDTSIDGAETLQASAYMHDTNGTLTVVLINTSPETQDVTILAPNVPDGIGLFDAYTSSESGLWESWKIDVRNDSARVNVPGYGVVTLHGVIDTGTSIEQPEAPGSELNLQHYPNPAGRSVTFSYTLARPGRVVLTVYDIVGRELARIVDGVQGTGKQVVSFDTATLPAGVYPYTWRMGETVRTGKIVVTR